ncbi:hypothetical protein ACTFIN_07155 [Clostridium cagae]|uniref:hypothetical protein n=1 Tax=Clostridium cagae TaxID=2080751 RepID=UPI003F7664E0
MDFSELNLNEEQLQGVQKIVQSENDKIRTEYSKKIKELEYNVPKKKSPEEIALEQRIKEIEEKEKALQKQEQLSNINKALEEKGLNPQLSKFINMEGVKDIETSLDELFNLVVGESKEKIYKPSDHINSINSGITREDFNKMGYKERLDLYNTDKDLYDALSK